MKQDYNDTSSTVHSRDTGGPYNKNNINLLNSNLNENLDKLKKIFSYPLNEDFAIRHIHIASLKKEGAIVFLKGMVDTTVIQTDIIKPLIEKTSLEISSNLGLDIIKKLILVSGVETINTIQDIIDKIVEGSSLLLIDGYDEAIAMDTAGYEHRSVGKPQNETVLKGAQEGFIESSETNRSLIRKLLKSEKLITESITIGKECVCKVSIMYMSDITPTKLIDDVRNRIKQVDVEGMISLNMLEQHLEERTYSIVPTILYTERPDRGAASLLEGHVLLLMDNSPNCLIMPALFWDFFQTSEDVNQRWAFGNFIRILRLVALFVAMLTPAFYVAVTNYHAEMIPTDLLLAIASTRERVPFPVVIEIMIMEVAFELVREASTRIPTNIGPTIGIVGALILGQAAVEANVVSPILVIVVAITGLSSFAIPNISFNYTVRLARFIFLAAAMFMGFVGIEHGFSLSNSFKIL